MLFEMQKQLIFHNILRCIALASPRLKLHDDLSIKPDIIRSQTLHIE